MDYEEIENIVTDIVEDDEELFSSLESNFGFTIVEKKKKKGG